jgi:hypothetical protein
MAQSREIAEFRVPHDFPLGLADDLRKRGLLVTPGKRRFLSAAPV